MNSGAEDAEKSAIPVRRKTKRGRGYKMKENDPTDQAGMAEAASFAAANDDNDALRAKNQRMLEYLREHKETIKDLEHRLYEQADANDKAMEAERQISSQYATRIKDLEKQIEEIEDALAAEAQERVAAEDETKAYKTSVDRLKSKLADTEDTLHSTANLLNIASDDRDTLNTRLATRNIEIRNLQTHISQLTNDHRQRNQAEAEVTKAVDTLLGEQSGLQDDMTRKEEAFQALKDENEELKNRNEQLKRANKSLQSPKRRRGYGSEDDSDTESRLSTQNRQQHHHAVSLGQELEDLGEGNDTVSVRDVPEHINEDELPQNEKSTTTSANVGEKTSHLQHLLHHHWVPIFVIFILFMLLSVLFALYHGSQAQQERMMWRAANDYTRRAVYIHMRSGGKSAGWLTPKKIDLMTRDWNIPRKSRVEM